MDPRVLRPGGSGSSGCRPLAGRSWSLVLELVEAVVDAAPGQQLLVRARLAQLALVQHQDRVHVLDRRQPVRDRDRRPPGHQHVQRVADEHLRLGVHARRRLVEHQDRAGRTPAPARTTAAASAPTTASRRARPPASPSPPGSRVDEPVRVHGLGRRRTRSSSMSALPRRMLPAIVPENRWTSCSTRLNSRRRSAEVHLADVDAVDEDPPPADVVEPHQQVDDRRLARRRSRRRCRRARPGATSNETSRST